MASLDHVQNILAQEQHDDASNTKTSDTPPNGGHGTKTFVTKTAYAPANARAHTSHENISKGNEKINQTAQDNKRQGLQHDAHCAPHIKIPHGRLPPGNELLLFF